VGFGPSLSFAFRRNNTSGAVSRQAQIMNAEADGVTNMQIGIDSFGDGGDPIRCQQWLNPA